MYLPTLLALSTAVLTKSSSISYDNGYDNSTRSLATVSCYDELHHKYKWLTQSDVPNAPLLGGWDQIPGINTCGTCLAITYVGNTVNILAIDHTIKGVNMAQAAMDLLTGSQAESLGRVEAEVQVVDGAKCGLAGPKRIRVIGNGGMA
jgi:hypothetical protein